MKLLSQEHPRSPRCIYPPLEPGQEDPKTYLQEIWAIRFILSLGRKTAVSLRESLSIRRLSPGSLRLHHPPPPPASTTRLRPTFPDALQITSLYKLLFTHSLRHEHGEKMEMV